MAAKLALMGAGNIRRLIINVPPRHLKVAPGLGRVSGLVPRP
jgi:hypothetical protein